MTFAELKKVCNPSTLVSVSTEFFNKEENAYCHGMTLDHDVPIGNKEAFPDGAWFDNCEISWMGVYGGNLLMILLREPKVEEEIE